MRLGVVTGLDCEARCCRVLPSTGLSLVSCRGPGTAGAAAAAGELLAHGCTALLSFGMAGGLEAALAPGTLVIADSIVTEAGDILPTNEGWRDRVRRSLSASPVVTGRMGSSALPLLSIAAKRDWRARFGACAVDMESEAVARTARRAGVPFLVVRSIVDPAGRSIPRWIPDTIDGQGRPILRALVAGLFTRPHDLPALIRLAADQRAALATLRNVARDAGPLFGLA